MLKNHLFTVIKIGGSLFSDKFKDKVIDHQKFNKFADFICQLQLQAPGQLAMVTGGGSYGHEAVRQMDKTIEIERLNLTNVNFQLKWLWHQAFKERNIKSFPMQLASQTIYKGNGCFSINQDFFNLILSSRYLPILSGDSIFDNKGQLNLVGSDIIPGFCHELKIPKKRIIIMTDVPGVLTSKAGEQAITLTNINQDMNLKEFIWPTKNGDTSGQMYGKVTALLNHAKNGAECIIANGDDCIKYQKHLLKPINQWPKDFNHTVIQWKNKNMISKAVGHIVC